MLQLIVGNLATNALRNGRQDIVSAGVHVKFFTVYDLRQVMQPRASRAAAARERRDGADGVKQNQHSHSRALSAVSWSRRLGSGRRRGGCRGMEQDEIEVVALH